MGREPKPVDVLVAEGKSHRTKDELKVRREAEQAMLTGSPMKMRFKSKEHKIAAKEFKRIKELFAAVNKDDDIYGFDINTHCLLVEEIEQMQALRDEFSRSREELKAAYSAGLTGDPEEDGMKTSDYYKLLAKMMQSILDCDKGLMTKRKMILDISKENIMTVQSALRSIPKRPEKKTKSKMAAFMEHRAGDG